MKLFAIRSHPLPTDLSLLVLRVVAGAAFLYHGWPKIHDPFGWMPPEAGMPGVLQALAAVAEFGGGLAWILGLVTSLASLGLAITMAVAVYKHAIAWGDPFVSMEGGSWELAAVYLGVALVLMTVGPGRFSLDGHFAGRK